MDMEPEQIILPCIKFNLMEKFANIVMTKTILSRELFALHKDGMTMKRELDCFHIRPLLISQNSSAISFFPSIHRLTNEVLHIVGHVSIDKTEKETSEKKVEESSKEKGMLVTATSTQP